MKTLLITGAAGIVSTGIRPMLRNQYKLVLFDVVSAAAPADTETVLTGNISNPADVEAAMQGVDAILHLACRHGETVTFEETLDVNYRGTILLLEAALRAGASNIVFASSNHGWGFYPRSETPLPVTKPPRPDGWYGINKVWTEAVLSHYAEAFGMTATSLRIGNCGPAVGDERLRHMWISFRDFAQVVLAALDRKSIGHKAIFATADCDAPFFDNSGLKDLGVTTLDAPDDNLATPEILHKQPSADVFGTLTGGSYAAENMKIPLEHWLARRT